MPRPKDAHPTPGELEVLKVLWSRGPSTVREVMEVLNLRRERAYTSVMSLLNVMTEKRLVSRAPWGRAFRYQPRQGREETLARMVRDLLGRAFEGSASSLVAHVLEESNPSGEELDRIADAIAEYQRNQGDA